jgi:hypothetical protein
MSTESNAVVATTNNDATPAATTNTTDVVPAVVSAEATVTPSATPDAANSDPKAPVPTEIKYELKTPDGSLLSTEKIKEIEEFAKTNKLAPEKAQELLNRESALLKTHVETMQSQHNERVEVWKDVASKDKEIGGEAFGQNVEYAKRSLEKFATPELKTMLDNTGFGNHPEVLRVFARIGKAMSDDKILKGSPASNDSRSMAEKFYNTNKK